MRTQGSKFSVSVHCAEAPQITSEGHSETHYNFETKSGTFARHAVCNECPPPIRAVAARVAPPKPYVPEPTPRPKKKNDAGNVIIGAALGYTALVLLGVAPNPLESKKSGGGGSSCPTYQFLVDHGFCPSGGVCLPNA